MFPFWGWWSDGVRRRNYLCVLRSNELSTIFACKAPVLITFALALAHRLNLVVKHLDCFLQFPGCGFGLKEIMGVAFGHTRRIGINLWVFPRAMNDRVAITMSFDFLYLYPFLEGNLSLILLRQYLAFARHGNSGYACIPGGSWHAVAGGSKTGCCFCLCLCFLFGRRWVCSLVVFWCCSCWLFSVWIVALVTSSAISFCMIHTWCFSHLFFAHLFGLFCAPTAAFAWCVGTRTLFMKKRALFAFRAVSFVKLPTILLGPIWCTTATRWVLSAFLFFFCWQTCLFFWTFHLLPVSDPVSVFSKPLSINQITDGLIQKLICLVMFPFFGSIICVDVILHQNTVSDLPKKNIPQNGLFWYLFHACNHCIPTIDEAFQIRESVASLLRL